MKDFKSRDVVQNIWEKTTENFDFVENSNIIRRSAEAAVRGCSGEKSQKNTEDGVLL